MTFGAIFALQEGIRFGVVNDLLQSGIKLQRAFESGRNIAQVDRRVRRQGHIERRVEFHPAFGRIDPVLHVGGDLGLHHASEFHGNAVLLFIKDFELATFADKQFALRAVELSTGIDVVRVVVRPKPLLIVSGRPKESSERRLKGYQLEDES